MALFDLKGRTALITGASSGLGRRFAKVLAQQGADVVVVARRLEKLEELAGEIRLLNVRCLPLKCDATIESEVISTVANAISQFGKIDILINNAGIATGGKAENTSSSDFLRVLDVNVNGLFYFAREVGKSMIKEKYGRIINIASMYGLVGNKFSPTIAYHTSKGAVINFARGLAAEWGKHNITVNNIGPGFFESEMTGSFFNADQFMKFVENSTCLGREGEPEELDTALIFLAANESSYITGQTIYVDGGWTAI
ncbi:MAG: SDR family NAD(P)-dependent oxidoreductase [Dysgonomonas sp.]